MQDIVDKLRGVGGIESGILYSRRSMLNEAANTIESLRSRDREGGSHMRKAGEGAGSCRGAHCPPTAGVSRNVREKRSSLRNQVCAEED